ncbi:MAG: enoyl-CoA hydratase/isomerase family protein [Planctomycetaceae bacterium]|nr:enoyl-CoA hydratase/isomerase family protein [Planctomycetaceae bacterium]
MNVSTYENFQVEPIDDGHVQVTLNVPGRSMNVLDERVLAELEQIATRLENDTALRGVLFRSGKPAGFLAGADVRRIAAIRTADEAGEIVRRGQELFSRIERLPVPTVAAIHGPCLGGGLELALACTARIARDDGSTRLGLPEVQLGLLPAWGGTQRLPRLIGLVPALKMMLTGSRLKPDEALQKGLVDRVADKAGFEAAARKFLTDLTSGRVGMLPVCRSPRRVLSWLTGRTRPGRALVRKGTLRQIARSSQQYPALREIVETATAPVAVDNLQAGFDREAAAFARLLFTPACRNLLGLFFGREEARTPESWVPSAAELPVETADSGGASTRGLPEKEVLGVIGAGVMGAGIATLAVSRGLQVIVREADAQTLDAGMARIRGQLEKSVQAGRMSADERDACLSRLSGCTSAEDLRHATIVVEAVPERLEIKQAVFRELAGILARDDSRDQHVVADGGSGDGITPAAGAAGRPALL